MKKRIQLVHFDRRPQDKKKAEKRNKKKTKKEKKIYTCVHICIHICTHMQPLVDLLYFEREKNMNKKNKKTGAADGRRPLAYSRFVHIYIYMHVYKRKKIRKNPVPPMVGGRWPTAVLVDFTTT